MDLPNVQLFPSQVTLLERRHSCPSIVLDVADADALSQLSEAGSRDKDKEADKGLTMIRNHSCPSLLHSPLNQKSCTASVYSLHDSCYHTMERTNTPDTFDKKSKRDSEFSYGWVVEAYEDPHLSNEIKTSAVNRKISLKNMYTIVTGNDLPSPKRMNSSSKISPVFNKIYETVAESSRGLAKIIQNNSFVRQAKQDLEQGRFLGRQGKQDVDQVNSLGRQGNQVEDQVNSLGHQDNQGKDQVNSLGHQDNQGKDQVNSLGRQDNQGKDQVNSLGRQRNQELEPRPLVDESHLEHRSKQKHNEAFPSLKKIYTNIRNYQKQFQSTPEPDSPDPSPASLPRANFSAFYKVVKASKSLERLEDLYKSDFDTPDAVGHLKMQLEPVGVQKLRWCVLKENRLHIFAISGNERKEVMVLMLGPNTSILPLDDKSFSFRLHAYGITNNSRKMKSVKLLCSSSKKTAMMTWISHFFKACSLSLFDDCCYETDSSVSCCDTWSENTNLSPSSARSYRFSTSEYYGTPEADANPKIIEPQIMIDSVVETHTNFESVQASTELFTTLDKEAAAQAEARVNALTLKIDSLLSKMPLTPTYREELAYAPHGGSHPSLPRSYSRQHIPPREASRLGRRRNSEK